MTLARRELPFSAKSFHLWDTHLRVQTVSPPERSLDQSTHAWFTSALRLSFRHIILCSGRARNETSSLFSFGLLLRQEEVKLMAETLL